MKSRPVLMLGIAGLLLISSAAAKDKEPAGQTVDTGSFGVFMNGHRIATEKFSIQQSTLGSVATSDVKKKPGVEETAQSKQLLIIYEPLSHIGSINFGAVESTATPSSRS